MDVVAVTRGDQGPFLNAVRRYQRSLVAVDGSYSRIRFLYNSPHLAVVVDILFNGQNLNKKNNIYSWVQIS